MGTDHLGAARPAQPRQAVSRPSPSASSCSRDDVLVLVLVLVDSTEVAQPLDPEEPPPMGLSADTQQLRTESKAPGHHGVTSFFHIQWMAMPSLSIHMVTGDGGGRARGQAQRVVHLATR